MIEIRLGRESDLDPILELFTRVAEERLWIGTEPGFDPVEKRARFRTSVLDPERSPTWVAYDGARIVGHLAIFNHREAGPCIGMLIDAEYRRRGIGRSLLEHSFAWGRARGLESLALHVFPHNEAARGLYRALGFEKIERYESDVIRQTGEVWDTILMRKNLKVPPTSQDKGPAA